MITETGWQGELEPIAKTWFLNEYLKMPSKRGMIADMGTSKKAKDTYYGISGVEKFQEFKGTVPTTTPSEQYKVEITHKKWAQSILIDQDMYDDDQSGQIKQLVEGLADAANLTKETNFWDLFNHAFDTTYVGGDTFQLCYSAHPSKAVSDTQSNAGSSALSASSLSAARLAARKFKTWEGNPMVNIMDTLLVPMDQEENAIVVTQSNLKSGTAYNDANVFQKEGFRFKVLVSEFLDDVNNWFTLNTMYSKKHLHYTTRMPLRLFNDSSSTTLVMKFAGAYRDSTGFSDYRWIYGSNVS
jgi:phage major head subunit gpT-like protein